jgi:hypothetical protein
MAATYADQGLSVLLQKRNLYAIGAYNVFVVRLYTAVSGGISKSSVAANFTEVGTGTMGYAAYSTNPATDWSYALDTTNHWVIGTLAHVWTFTPGAGLTIVGYYITQSQSGVDQLAMAEAFASPIVIPAGGGTLTLTLTDKYQQC